MGAGARTFRVGATATLCALPPVGAAELGESFLTASSRWEPGDSRDLIARIEEQRIDLALVLSGWRTTGLSSCPSSLTSCVSSRTQCIRGRRREFLRGRKCPGRT